MEAPEPDGVRISGDAWLGSVVADPVSVLPGLPVVKVVPLALVTLQPILDWYKLNGETEPLVMESVSV